MKKILASQVDLKLHLELLKDKKAIEAIAILTGDQDLMPLKLTEYKALILRLDYLESINDELLEAVNKVISENKPNYQILGNGVISIKTLNNLQKAIAKAESK